jgi:hypothetical protein
MKRLRQMLKGWNINVVGHYKKLKKNLISKIDILDKASEISGLSEVDRLEKLDLESNLRKIVDEEILASSRRLGISSCWMVMRIQNTFIC